MMLVKGFERSQGGVFITHVLQEAGVVEGGVPIRRVLLEPLLVKRAGVCVATKTRQEIGVLNEQIRVARDGAEHFQQLGHLVRATEKIIQLQAAIQGGQLAHSREAQVHVEACVKARVPVGILCEQCGPTAVVGQMLRLGGDLLLQLGKGHPRLRLRADVALQPGNQVHRACALQSIAERAF